MVSRKICLSMFIPQYTVKCVSHPGFSQCFFSPQNEKCTQSSTAFCVHRLPHSLPPARQERGSILTNTLPRW